MSQLEHIDAIEKRLGTAADTLRANSEYASNEYFLPVMGLVFLRHAYSRYTRFADQKAHDGGEFFTPVSLVSLIARVLDPERGTVLDPACGSGGMFVQSARTVEEHDQSPAERLTFRALEKNGTTIRLAKMNLAVHGLGGDIQQAITYYEDPYELAGNADYVMANSPFNVDEIDADKVRRDPRLPFGLPGVSKKGKVSNGNYIWISYFYCYLNERGRAGFVMSSHASSAGGGEAELRRRLVETGDVDAMVAIRSNFFYTRTVPCELWFLDRAKPESHRDKVLMLDARGVFRKVSRKSCDFSPEHQQNLLAIVWLYRGETQRHLELVSRYLGDTADEALYCFEWESEEGEAFRPIGEFLDLLDALRAELSPFLETQPKIGPHAGPLADLERERRRFSDEARRLRSRAGTAGPQWERTPYTGAALGELVERFAPLAEASRGLSSQVDQLHRLATRLIEICERECDAKSNGVWDTRDINRARKAADEARQELTNQDESEPVQSWGQLRKVDYFWGNARWLTERFPDAELCDVAGLVKLVDRAEIEANDWSLTPGRYVGVAPIEEDEDFDFAKAMREIHAELDELNDEAATLAAKIKKNFEELGI